MPPARRPGSRAAVAGLGLAAITALLLHGRATGPDPQPVAAISGEVGNGQPHVGHYDGQLVHRCQAVAVSVQAGVDVGSVRAALHAAGDRAGLPLLDVAPGVLPAAFLESSVPDVVACLPANASAADAARLQPQPLPGEDRRSVQAVLVHDLVLAVRPARTTPQAVAEAVDREGILADVLGRYGLDSTPTGQLRVRYTGQLLGDDEVDAVRAALARAAGVPPAAVSVGPGDTSSAGVDLRHAPPAPVVPANPSPHQHEHLTSDPRTLGS